MAFRHLDQACDVHGRFRYRAHLDPTVQLKARYNIVRHAGAVYALADYASYLNAAAAGTVERSAGYLLRTAVASVPGRANLAAVWSHPHVTDSVPFAQAKLGATGLALAALARTRRLGPELVPLDTIAALCRFVQYLQHSDGSFASKYLPEKGLPDASWISLYYPGEAALGLLLCHDLQPQAGWRDSALQAMRYLADSRRDQHELPPDHWALIASAQLLTDSNPLEDAVRTSLVHHAAGISEPLLRLLTNHSDPGFGRGAPSTVATAMEGLLAVLDLLSADHPQLWQDILHALSSGLEFLLRAQIRHGPLCGGFPRRHGQGEKRSDGLVQIDFTQHALSALIEYHRRYDQFAGCAPTHAAKAPDFASLLEESLQLSMRFLHQQQLAAGNFTYEYDWITRACSSQDNAVRQAGTMWALALYQQIRPDPVNAQAAARALAFFHRHSGLTDTGARFIRYPGSEVGHTGTIALCALSLIDLLRSGGLGADMEHHYLAQLREYIDQLLAARQPDGLWHQRYELDNGKPFGPASPYFDGESLLALVKAAKYIDGFEHLRPAILSSAASGFRRHILLALRRDPDSPATKGYYQWSTMAFYELVTSGWDDTAEYAEHILYLADWMIDVHRVLSRARNTAYAFEGLACAFAVAQSRHDGEHVSRYRQVIQQGLSKLLSWQVGHSTANEFIRRQRPRANDLGGVQNRARDALLRVDVTQHTAHAVLLALRHLYGDAHSVRQTEVAL